MPRFGVVALTLLCCVLAAAPVAAVDYIQEASFEVNTGVRQDNFIWDTSGIVQFYDVVTVSSELEWEDLNIYEVGGKGRLVVGNSTMPFATCIRVRGAYGEIYDGEVRDSDYVSADNSKYEFSRSISDGDDGYTFTLNAGIGPQFSFWDGKMSVAFLVGYNYHEQNLRLKNGLQVIGDGYVVPEVGYYMPDLSSSYDATWEGAWVGVDAALRLSPRLMLEASVEVQDVNYEAEANWNLRDDLAHPVSFEHDADGISVITSAALHYLLNDSWALSGNINYGYMVTDAGTHTAYGSDGSVTKIRLKEVEWDSIGATLGLRCIF